MFAKFSLRLLCIPLVDHIRSLPKLSRQAQRQRSAARRPSGASGGTVFGQMAFRWLKQAAGRGTVADVSIEVSETVEQQLRTLAAREGRDVASLVEDALRQYLEGAAITDVTPSQVAAAQTGLLTELTDLADWKAEDV